MKTINPEVRETVKRELIKQRNQEYYKKRTAKGKTCECCSITVDKYYWDTHVQTNAHKKREKIYKNLNKNT